MEGFVFQFPDFDDMALNAENINFEDPNGFYFEFNKRYPGQWGAVSWEYASASWTCGRPLPKRPDRPSPTR